MPGIAYNDIALQARPISFMAGLSPRSLSPCPTGLNSNYDPLRSHISEIRGMMVGDRELS